LLFCQFSLRNWQAAYAEYFHILSSFISRYVQCQMLSGICRYSDHLKENVNCIQLPLRKVVQIKTGKVLNLIWTVTVKWLPTGYDYWRRQNSTALVKILLLILNACCCVFIHLLLVPNLEHRAPFGVSVIILILGRKVGLLWTSDQPVSETSTYTGQHNINTRETSMPRAGFETATPATKRPQTYALDREATGIGSCVLIEPKIINAFKKAVRYMQMNICMCKSNLNVCDLGVVLK
jgi:hypothetical protein